MMAVQNQTGDAKSIKRGDRHTRYTGGHVKSTEHKA